MCTRAVQQELGTCHGKIFGGGGGGMGDSCVRHVTAHQEQEQARSTENAESNEGCTNESGNVRGTWHVIVTKVSGLHAHEGSPPLRSYSTNFSYLCAHVVATQLGESG